MEKVYDFTRVPVVDIVNEILVDATKMGASDIHFDPNDNYVQIRVRVDGELSDYTKVPIEYSKNLITRIKIIAGMNITESRLPQDGAIKGIIKDVELDLRVSSINTNKGEKIVIRILDYTLSLNGIEKLGFSDFNYKKVIEMINEPNGIILVTGATGTGKSTTVYSMLQKLNNKSTNIMSIEDPIEMDIEGVNQIQVNPEIGLTFATALRSILRQDPNIIMIGEIRDSETAAIAIRASITGHLVLSTLHTNDSLSTIERLMDMEVEKYLLAEAITGIISQKLARKLCPYCKAKRVATDYEKDLVKKSLNIDIEEVYESRGCDKCHHGYKGRIAIQEVLKIDQKVKDALSMNVRKDKLRNLVYDNNVITLLQDGLIKAVRGDTTIEEILKLIELDKDINSSFNLTEAIINSELTKSDNSHIDEALVEEEQGINYVENSTDEYIVTDDTENIEIIDNNKDDEIKDNQDDTIDDTADMDDLNNDDNILDKIETNLETENEETEDQKDIQKNEEIEDQQDIQENEEIEDQQEVEENEKLEKQKGNEETEEKQEPQEEEKLKDNERIIYVKDVKDIIETIKNEEIKETENQINELLNSDDPEVEKEKIELEKNNIDNEKKEILEDMQNELSNKVKKMMIKRKVKKKKSTK